MNTISIRLPDDILREVDCRAAEFQISRAEYLRRAIVSMNRETRSCRQRLRLMEVSARVREESMAINREFAEIEHDPET
ncbi:MAG: ribbon-helix-helix protein, CopG family [Syntrophales bacterium]|nr:ribbon-helix-helix protein, CopG family [Syntrophales bacterium]